MTKLQRLTRRPAPERGFTLIELLVVIIILGILAAVVVFAVSGVGDKGKSSAVSIDARTLRTAEEAYCAKNGQYGSGQELVAGGFLSDSPEYHNVAAQKTGFGQCNGWTYSILETAAATPPGSDPGTWAAGTPDFPGTYTLDAIRLPSGNVAVFGGDADYNYVTFLWEVATGTWSQRDTGRIDGGISYGSRYNLAPVLTQNCGLNCGSILINVQGNAEGQFWYLFDPERPTGAQWRPVTPQPPDSPGRSDTLTELRDNPSTAVNECGSNCGKVLKTGGNATAALYDPNMGPAGGFVPLASTDPFLDSDGPRNMTALLPDGRVLIVGRCYSFPTCTNPSAARFFDPITLTFSDAPSPSLGLTTDPFSGSPTPPVMANGGILFGGSQGSREIYTPEYGQPGSWTGVVPSCGDSFCQIVGALPDGRVLAYNSADEYRFSSATSPGQSFVLDPVTRAWSRSGDFDQQAAGDGVLLDPRTGPCGAFCNKMLMVFGSQNGGTYHAAFFTP